MEESKRSVLSSIRDIGASSAFGFNHDDSDLNVNGSTRSLQLEWVCAACTYHNVDYSNPMCSVCGQERGLEREERRPRANSEACPTASNRKSPPLKSPPREKVECKNQEELERPRCSNSKEPIDSSQVTENLSDFALCSLVPSLDAGRSLAVTSASHIEARKQSEEDVHPNGSWSKSSSYNDEVRTWNCSLCTFHNTNPLHLVCRMCGHRRNGKTVQATPENSETSFRSTSIPAEQENDILNQVGLAEDEDLKALQTQYVQELIAFQAKVYQEIQNERDEETRTNESSPSTTQEGSRRNTQVSRCA